MKGLNLQMSGIKCTDWLILRRLKRSVPNQRMPIIRRFQGLVRVPLADWLFLRQRTLTPLADDASIWHGLDRAGQVNGEYSSGTPSIAMDKQCGMVHLYVLMRRSEELSQWQYGCRPRLYLPKACTCGTNRLGVKTLLTTLGLLKKLECFQTRLKFYIPPVGIHKRNGGALLTPFHDFTLFNTTLAMSSLFFAKS